MALTDYTMINVAPDLSAAQFRAILSAAQSPALSAADAVYAYCVQRRVSPAFLLAMFEHESRYGTQGTARETHSWGNTRSPSFGGVREVGQAEGRSGTFPVFANWVDGGISTVARFLDHPAYLLARTVRQIIPIWAPPSDGNDTEAYIAAVLTSIARDVAQEGQTTVAPLIVLSSGHHNKQGGDAIEIAQTGKLTPAIAAACRAAGLRVLVLTPDDGAGMSPDSLDTIAARCPTDAAIYLETHTEAGPRGVFAIYPDWPSAGDVDTDVRDVLGPAIAESVSKSTGLPVRGNGIMSERETGVGAGGDRLGIFRATANLRQNTTRLIVEFGSHTSAADLALINAPGFYAQAAGAVAGAFAAYLHVAPPIVSTGEGIPPMNNPAYDSVTGMWIAPALLTYYAQHDGPRMFGHPIGPAVKYSDGATRQLFERACLGIYADGTIAIEGLGQAYAAATGKVIAEWPNVTPLLAK